MRRTLGVLAAALAVASPAAAADPAALDRSYGAGGVIVLRGDAATLLPDGRAVGAGAGGAIERVGLDGRVRRTRAVVPHLRVAGIAAGSDGTIAVAGRRGDDAVVLRVRPGAPRELVVVGPADSVFSSPAVAADGSVYLASDSSAIVRVAADGTVEAGWAHARPGIVRMVWTPRGLLVGGHEYVGSDVHGFSVHKAFLTRLTAAGEPDPRFGTGGSIELGDSVALTALVPHGPGGALLSTSVCGEYKGSPCNTFSFSRIDAAGGRRGGAWSRGVTGDVNALAVERDGDVLAAGHASDRRDRSSGFYVRRYLDGRRPDRRFGRCGRGAAPHTPKGSGVQQMAVQRSGRIVGLLGTYDGTPTRPRLIALRGGHDRATRARACGSRPR